MKVFLLALFVAAAASAPAPLDEETGEPVELIVNGLGEGEPLEIGDLIGLKLKEHVNGEIVSATNLLHPLTAAGIAEAAAAAELESNPEPVEDFETLPEAVEIVPEPVELPAPALPEVVPDSIDLPAPALPEVSEVVPDLNLPEPSFPEVAELVPDLNLPAPPLPGEIIPVLHPTGEVFNDGIVQVTVNAPEPELLSTVQSWFNMVLNYFNDDVQTTHQIV